MAARHIGPQAENDVVETAMTRRPKDFTDDGKRAESGMADSGRTDGIVAVRQRKE